MDRHDATKREFFTTINERVGWDDEPIYKAVLKKEVNRSFRSRQPLTQIVLEPNLTELERIDMQVIEKFLLTLTAIIDDNSRNIDIKSIHQKFVINLLLVDTALDGAKIFIEKCISAILAAIESTGNKDYLHIFKHYKYNSFPLNQIAGTDHIEAMPVFINNFEMTSFQEDETTKISIFPNKRLFLDWNIIPNSGGVLTIDNSNHFFNYFPAKSEKLFRLQKRVLDIFGATLGLILASPFIAVITLLVKLTSKGPVFFRQKRVGRAGKEFTFFKFRTMHVDNNDAIHKAFVQNLINSKPENNNNGNGQKVFKIENDPRVTSIGRFLRKSSLDEIPQFYNVLKGEMSLVGPRPPIAYEVSEYKSWHTRRLQEAKPGLTGMWQVFGRSSTTFNEQVRLDIQYLDQQSIGLDLKILLLTIPAVMKGRGAV